MQHEAADHEERVGGELGCVGRELEPVGGVGDDGEGDGHVDQAVEVELAGRDHEQRRAGLGEEEVEVAAAHVAPELEEVAPEKGHEQALDELGGADEQEHLVFRPTGDAVGVVVDDAHEQHVRAHPEKLHQRPHEEVAAKHHGAHQRVADAGEPDAGVADEGGHGRKRLKD